MNIDENWIEILAEFQKLKETAKQCFVQTMS